MDYKMEELLPIVFALAEEYAGYESTSVTYEDAQVLMEAVLYCLNEYRDYCKRALVCRNLSLKEQYNVGTKLILKKVNDIRKIYNEVSVCFEDFGVKCLYDTVQNGVLQFLKWYDIKFCPQDTIVTLEYPLLIEWNSLAGADAVYEYIRAIQIEQQFLRTLDKSHVIAVLERYNFGYRDMTENICSIVLMNIIGHVAIKKNLNNVGFSHEEYFQLSEMFKRKAVSDTENVIRDLIENMVRQFYENNIDMLEYLCCETNNIAVRIHTANECGKLNEVFVL